MSALPSEYTHIYVEQPGAPEVMQLSRSPLPVPPLVKC